MLGEAAEVSFTVCVGGGCVEATLSIYLENFATSLSSREQLAIADFAKSQLAGTEEETVDVQN